MSFIRLFILPAFTCFLSLSHAQSSRLMFSSELNGLNVVPPVTTSALGVASFLLNETRDTLQVNISVNGLGSKVIGVYIHEGAAWTNGPVVADLTAYLQGTQLRAGLSGSNLSSLLPGLISGALYLSFHTFGFAGGEIRGQLIPETDYGFYSTLSGSEVVPAVTTPATALAVLKLNRKADSLDIFVTINGLAGPVDSAHLHAGGPGENGLVVADLFPLLDGGRLKGTIPFSTALVNDLDSGLMYIDIQSTLYPGGEIRGQVLKAGGVPMDAIINNGQVHMAPSVTNGFGTGTFRLNATFDSLFYDILIDSLSDTLTYAHFHLGVPGQPGTLIYALPPPTGNRFTGSWSKSTASTPLTTEIVTAFLAGNVYVDFHTTPNPQGELRGQVRKLGREGIVFELDGKQVVPGGGSNALGGGLVSIGRDEKSLHYMVCVSGLSEPVNAAHFHRQARGNNGPEIFDFTLSFFNNGAFGYWDQVSSPPFSSAHASSFFTDSMYIDLHSGAHPAGEVRGQAGPSYRSSFTTSVYGSVPGFEFKVWPNPFSESLSILVDGTSPARITLTDMSGRVIFETTTSGISGAITLDPGFIAPGIYLLRLEYAGQQGTIRLGRF